ncbi:Rpn family recombination-promoting nuclease/putative transposase [Robertmurraya andreesenii]|uniref:Transposase/invertase (TIGR01784 family) n=1 Tax=Anoxybacillus andreesenii TaxID=1325932 RepID=A0ABT9V819_9BACL|nr:Rpn family recombination-promoting nuclease/putative transposase [Robertmurraya andreesenii]MDQ0157105.1 putative transposase/invertase (TIGR01784 family) [Robertmurraya andreesenii]
MPDYDRLWKEIISELFEEFLLFFAPDLYEIADFSQPPQSREQELQKLFPSSKSKNRRADKLIGLKLKNGQEQWILVHIEVQGDRDPDFPMRMFQYFYRALDKFNQKLFAIALFTDDSSTFKPNIYNYHFFGTELIYKYQAYKILEQDEAELLQSNNPFSLVILAGLYVLRGKKQENLKYPYKRRLMRLLLKNTSLDRKKIERLFIFIDHVIELQEEETEALVYEITPMIEKEGTEMSLSLEDTSFAKYYKRIGKEEGREEGIKEGEAKGMILGQKEVARKMLQEGYSIDVITKLTELSKEEIENL